MPPRKIFVLTGKRGGFGAMKPMLSMLRDDPEFTLQLVVTDQHVNKKFGNTLTEVRREFPIAAAVDMEQEGDTALSRARAVGLCAKRMSEVLHELKPDVCVLYGDRGEVLATAMAATLLGIPIAHLQGGDVSGSLDEQMRHAITKLAHMHFPSTQESAERIKRMGEEPWRIIVVGDHHIDMIVAKEFAPPEIIAKDLKLDLSKPVIVLLQHPETTAPGDAYDQMMETLYAIRDTGHQTIVVHPCSDQGYEGILRAIEEIAHPPQFTVRVNLDAPIFWGLLNVASVLVGNSSAGLIETPSFRLPAINIGRRQEGRLCAENVIHVDHFRAEIEKALEKALHEIKFRSQATNCTQPFGEGKAGKKVISVLRKVPLNDELMIKRMTF